MTAKAEFAAVAVVPVSESEIEQLQAAHSSLSVLSHLGSVLGASDPPLSEQMNALRSIVDRAGRANNYVRVDAA
jgi:hypothetical protein